MNIVISNKSGLPIYEQIKEQIKAAIICDEIKEGEILPSIRSLAQDLKISVITTMRAYTDLEQEGFVSSMQGKGYFVLPKDSEHIKEQKLREIELHFYDAIAASKIIGLPNDELIQVLKILLEEQN
ncbi:MAG: GntR family transcriptional regulator [Firmicutes bacterium]|nr:GntR family transcriptional regulator [Bacillota bacterium]